MNFPGGRLLHTWELESQRVTLDDLLRSCGQVGLTGFAELKLSNGIGMIFYYLGAEVSAVFREGGMSYHGTEALDHLRTRVTDAEGTISAYELPMEMAHLLRGITNRRRLPESPRRPEELHALLEGLKRDEHTGMLEIQAGGGAALMLLVNGRISNMYWETGGGTTLEMEPALVGLQQALRGETTTTYLSDFSRERWKARHEVQAIALATLDIAGREALVEDVDHETTRRKQVLRELDEQVPSLVQAFLFDLFTGLVLARRVRGSAALQVAVLADKLPALVREAREIVMSDGEPEIDVLEIEASRVTALVVVVPEVQEGLALLSDKSQPIAHLRARLQRTARNYAARVKPGPS
jgi:hypothetical protein